MSHTLMHCTALHHNLRLESRSTLHMNISPLQLKLRKCGTQQHGIPLFRPSRSLRVKKCATCAVAGAAVEVPKTRGSKLPSFPFVRIVGQDDMKLALLLNMVDPNIGGVLIMGDRGTGKSVVVRALVDLLPEIDVVSGDGFNSSPTDPKLMGPQALAKYEAGEQLTSVKMNTPLIELPLGATEDRICGTIDIEKALSEGVRAYEPGLLARANRGILYVDEVNLLDDSLVDVVLDSSASGVNTVEREGVSIVHPAKFIMIGSGNPEEGELRPQLLDRFGLSVQVRTLLDPDQRTQLVLDRMAFDKDPDAFLDSVKSEEEALKDKLAAARKLVPRVTISYDLKLKISEICSLVNVDGLRGDLVINRAAKAYAAYEGRSEVVLSDIERVVGMCLNHRLRKDPLDPIDSGTKVALAFQRITKPKAEAKPESPSPSPATAASPEAKESAKDASGDTEKRTGMKPGAWKGIGM